MNLTRGINLRKIAEMMPGASGAEVKVGVFGVSFLSFYLKSIFHVRPVIRDQSVEISIVLHTVTDSNVEQ